MTQLLVVEDDEAIRDSLAYALRAAGFEVNEAAQVVTSAADQNANVIFGAVIDESFGDQVRVTVIATGFGPGRMRRRRRVEEPTEQAKGEAERERETPAERFELTDDELEVPSFLRD